MVPTNSLSVFIAQNDSELRQMTAHLCETFNYPGDPGDIVQDMYLKFLTSPVVQNYQEYRTIFPPDQMSVNRKACRGCGECSKKCPQIFSFQRNKCHPVTGLIGNKHKPAVRKVAEECPSKAIKLTKAKEFKVQVKMSTYLYSVIKNHILTRLKSHDNRLVRFQLPDCDPAYDDQNEMDTIMHHIPVDRDYQTILLNNASSEDFVEGLGADLKDFETYFFQSDKNKKYSLSKRKNKDIKTSGCTLVDILRYLYDGYTNSEIAAMYGVTNMSVTNLKQKLAKEMMKFGFKTTPATKSAVPTTHVVVPSLKERIERTLKNYIESNGREWIPLAKYLSEAREKNEDVSFTGLKNNTGRMISAYKFLKEWRPEIFSTPERIRCQYRALSPLGMLFTRLGKKDQIEAILDKVLDNQFPAYAVERYATSLIDKSKQNDPHYVIEEHKKKFIVQ